MAACRDLQWNHDTSTFIAQKRMESQKSAVRSEGTAIALVRSGLPEEWWDCAIHCCCYLRNLHDKMAVGKTAFEKRFGRTFVGSSVPLGTLVEYIPITAKDKSSVHQFGKQTLKGIFFGYVLRVGRGWSGDVMISDYEDLQESEASDLDVKRFKNQEVFVKGEYAFPCANGTLRLPHRPRPSSIAQDNFEQEDDVEIEKGDKKGKQHRRCVVHGWRISSSTP